MNYGEKPRRRRWGCFFFLILLVIGGGVLFKMVTSGPPDLASGTVLELKVSGPLWEGPALNPLEEITQRGGLSLWEIRRALAQGTEDERIAGLKLVIEPLAGTGWGAIEELREILGRFRASGKPVHAFLSGDIFQESEYFLATAADKIWVNRESGALLNGIEAAVTFFRGSLEKLKIEPNVLMFKEYKSAGEPFSRREMSRFYREALSDVLSDIYDRFIEGIAERRGLDRERLRRGLDRGLMTTRTLLEEGWIDAVGYLDELEEELAQISGGGGYHGLALRRYRDVHLLPKLRGEEPRIAIVFGEGAIVASSEGSPFSGRSILGPVIAKAIADAANDERVKAIVFRVNSPGGSAVGSDLIWREIENAKAAGKPVVVSMSSVAGSGGYWISMAADAIVAQPSTITGSIGVVGMKFNLKGLYAWLGTNIDTSVSFGKHADLWSPFSSWTPEQRDIVKAWMGSIYADFVTKVARGRKMDFEAVEKIARGRIWSGRDAVERGLVDRIGDLDDAIDVARQKAGIPKEAALSFVLYPKRKSLLEQLFSGEFSLAEARAWLAEQRASALERDLVRLDALRAPRVWLWMPEIEFH